jgi:hypothetical protein
MFSQPKTDSVTRSVASVTLDGRKLTAEVSILLYRAMGRGDAEALATQVAGIVDDILSAQIVQGQAPLTAGELEALTLAKAKGLGKVARVRITSLRLSVPPASAHVPTARPAPTKPPDRVPSSHESGTRPGPTHQASSPPGSRAPIPSRQPAAGAAMPSRQPISGAPGPSRPASSAPPLAVAAQPSERPAAVQGFGAALALPLRDAAARAVLSSLSVITTGRVDRLSLLEGKPPAPELCREVCACFAATIYGECVARGESHKIAAAKVEAVCQHAFPDAAGPSATEIGFYIAIVAPLSELASRIASIVGCERDLPPLRAALTSSAAGFSERLAILYERLS